ncbi:MAG: cysteine--tRNA ligase [Gammaproteobacteria bacterium]
MKYPPLRIHNSLTRTKAPFTPRREKQVDMYVCGVTVYNDSHLGHARMLVVFDIVVRYLCARGYKVRYVRNITDIDDKIIRRAAANKEDWRTLAERYTQRLYEDERALGLVQPDAEPRATEHLGEIISMIARLIETGYAYVADNGDVYYAVSRFSGYGKLSGHKPEDLRAGARVEPDEAKHDPLDFALWKSEKPGEPAWNAPWGRGRPGWHIECSAMATHQLGNHFDIHGGGLDLKFPHHENEIAQSEAATGETFADVWMHNGFVEVGSEKMAKSLGNFTTVRDLLSRWPGETLRFFIATSHYRSPLSYTPERISEAHAGLSRLYIALRGLNLSATKGDDAATVSYIERFHAAMSDDFNTPEALAVLFDLAREINRRREAGEAAEPLAVVLRELAEPLGLLQMDPDAFLRLGDSGEISADAVEKLLEERRTARTNRNFKRADEIRDELTERGIVLEDSAENTLWRRF